MPFEKPPGGGGGDDEGKRRKPGYEKPPLFEDDGEYIPEDPEWKEREAELMQMQIMDALFLFKSILAREQEAPDRGPHDPSYTFFPFSQERRELFHYCAELSEYLMREKVANLVILDRSARPLYVGVKEYLEAKYPDEKLPEIKFMNPKGFKSRDDLTPREAAAIAEDAEWKGDVYESFDRVRTDVEILDELEVTYRRLMEDKDKPLAIFDTCIHTGESVRPVLDALEAVGFEDVRVGAVTPADSNSVVQTDFHLTRQLPTRGCYPFDKDRLVEKTFDHVYSNRTDDPWKRRAARQLREEIRRVMQEGLKAEEDRE